MVDRRLKCHRIYLHTTYTDAEKLPRFVGGHVYEKEKKSYLDRTRISDKI